MFYLRLFKSAVVFILFSTLAMAVDIPELPKKMSVSRALYINCLQRTQTQQLFKEYLLVALGSSYKHPKESLAKSIVAYQKRLDELDVFFQPLLTDPAIKKMIADAMVIWKESKAMLEVTPTKENALVLEKNFHKMVKLLGKYKVLSKKSFKAVGLAGGLCRDPLYMVNTYLMKVWGVDNPNYIKEMKKRIAHFDKNTSEMKSYDGNTKAILKNIADAQKAFQFFTFMYDSDTVAIPTLLSKKADNIFVNIRTIKRLYGELVVK
jgi:hypothetical protein